MDGFNGCAKVDLSMDDPIIQREVKSTSVTLFISDGSNSYSAILTYERYSSLSYDSDDST